MKIQYTFDDSAARLPLSIRSTDSVWDRAAELRNAPGVHLVELTTQHMLTTGTMLVDELAYYFDTDGPSEIDPYGLETCYMHRAQLEDLLRDLNDGNLIALQEVEALFPVTFMETLNVLVALTAVGYPAFGYVRTYHDSEGEEYHGLVVNLAQARPHLEAQFEQFSLSLLIETIRYGFFNHEAFQLAYDTYCTATDRVPDKLAARLKDALLSRGIAWYLSYRHNLNFYDQVLGLDEELFAAQVEQWNATMDSTYKKKMQDDPLDDWLQHAETRHPGQSYLDVVGFFAARAIAAAHGTKGLRDSIVEGPDYFIELYNALGGPQLGS